MTEKLVEVSLDGLVRLQTAAKAFARPEITRIADAVINELQSSPAIGLFEDVAARHMWDEYRWVQQEGPFDVDMGWDNVRLGSHSDHWHDHVRAFVSGEVEKLSKHALVFLSAYIFEEDTDIDEEACLGGISVEGIIDKVMAEIIHRASGRRLDLIGPDRGDVIGYEIQGTGMVWSVLSDRGEAMTLVAGHVDTMINPDADLSELAEELVEAFIAAANEDSVGSILGKFLVRFKNDVRLLLLEQDIVPSLNTMRDALIKWLDG